jgi:hypothetical protein
LRNPNSIGRPFKKGLEHPNWKGGVSLSPNYEKIRYCGRRKEDITKRNRNRTKEQMKDGFIKSVYGITLKDYEEMFEKQRGVCAICGNPETRKSRYSGICRLTIDHNHITKNVRGLLCHKCNNGLGNFVDNPEILLKAISYLKERN